MDAGIDQLYNAPQASRSVPPKALSGFAMMFHSNDDISLFVSFFDIPVRLDDLLERIHPVNDRFYLPRLNQLFEED